MGIGEYGQVKFKVRLVIGRLKDWKEYELKETPARVSRLTVVRSVIVIINKYNLEARQMDVKTA